jgi:tetratricopeptide (TPR) repeat protein
LQNISTLLNAAWHAARAAAIVGLRPVASARYGPRVIVLASYLYRALYLLGLAIAPRLLSPDPATPRSTAAALLVALAGLFGLLAGAYLFKKRLDTREARIAAALTWVSVAAAIGAAIYFTGPEAPLVRGAAPLALVVWPTLAATASALAGSYLGANFKHKRTAAAAAVIAGGLFVHGDANRKLGDRAFLWKTALDRDPAHEVAFDHVARQLMAQGKLAEAGKRLDACLQASPGACTCLVAKGTLAQRRRDPAKALEATSEAARQCPTVTAARAANAEALAAAGKLDEALAEADAAVALTDDPARAHAARAVVLRQAGKAAEADEEAKKATSAAGGRDAAMVIAAMKIGAGDLDGAEAILRPLVGANPQDADAIYNLALVADKRGKYNDARNGYLAALKINPTYKEARYNLAMMTWRKGVAEEAKNHARKFAEIAPDDPAAATLLQMVGEKPAK